MSQQGFLTKALTDVTLKRRSFLKWSSALSGTAVLSKGLAEGLRPAKPVAAATEGEWITAACWHNCGGRCANKVYVQDGVVLRQKTDDTHEDSADYPQQRGCARGRSQRRQVFGADRIKYPMKRKNWEPGTGGKRDLRGRDEWVRISWEEALDLVANETKRILDQYGNKSILGSGPVINELGGAMETWGTVSEGSWPQPAIHMAGAACYPNDRLDYRNTKQIVFWGANPIWSSGGNPTYNYLQAKKAGAQIIVVDPFYHDSAQVLADRWVPIRPGTDAAALIGIAYHMIEHDLQDQDFLDKYTVGFDADHMPEGVDPKENFKDYVLGTYDGVPKTPEWASNICGTPPETLRWLAEQLASIKPTVLTCAAAPSRTYRGEQMVQAFLTVGWMTGNVGIPGGSVCQSYHAVASYGGPALVNPGGTGEPYSINPLFPYFFPYSDLPDHEDWHGPAWDEAWKAVLTGEYTAGTRGKVPCDIRMLWLVSFYGSGGNLLNQIPNITRGIEAVRTKLEFIVSSDIVLSTKSKYADIVLPATTPWEKPGGMFSMGGGEAVLFYSQVTEPLYEARDETWIERELAKRMDVDPDKIAPLSETQKMFNSVAGATVIKDNASGYEPLVTITADDIAALGVEGEPQQGRISYEEFKKLGVYQVPRAPGDKFAYITAQAFRDDPEANPLPTKSGKLEIHCQTLADRIAAYGYITLPPIAQYHPPVEGYEDTFADFDAGAKGEYPLQLVTIHYGRRSHSVFDNIQQLRAVFPQEFMMNPIDAEARGIEHGDTVLVTSRHGKVLRRAFLTERMTPGVVYLGEGAWVQMDEEKGIDLAGATNSLSGSNPTGQGVQPWNTCNVQVEKWDGDPLDPDVEWPQRIVL